MKNEKKIFYIYIGDISKNPQTAYLTTFYKPLLKYMLIYKKTL